VYVWPCIIYENDERYQLDATTVIHYHKYLYMLRASRRWAYRCPKHVDIFMIINHNCCIKLVPLVNFFRIIHNVTRLSWFTTSYSDKSSSRKLAAKYFIGIYSGLKCDAFRPSANYFPLFMQFLNFNHKEKACKRIYSISIHTICYFFTISLPLQRGYNKSDTRIVPRDPAVYSIYNSVPTPSVQTSIKNRVQILNRH
jgi:hypothetical protein